MLLLLLELGIRLFQQLQTASSTSGRRSASGSTFYVLAVAFETDRQRAQRKRRLFIFPGFHLPWCPAALLSLSRQRAREKESRFFESIQPGGKLHFHFALQNQTRTDLPSLGRRVIGFLDNCGSIMFFLFCNY